MKKAPEISVAMPVYNGAQWLPAAFDSILNQTFTDFEVVICDNASKDASEQVCRDFASQDTRIRYIRNPKNIGVANNYNKAFSESKGRFVKWATTNDYIEPTMLERCLEVLNARPDVVLCYAKTRLFDPKTNYQQDYEDDLNLQQQSAAERFRKFFQNSRLNNIMNGVIRSDALRRTRLYQNYIGADVNMIAELSLYGKFYEIPEYLFYRRMDPESATKLKSMEQIWRYYDPEGKKRMVFQNWKYYLGLLGPALKAPIPLREKQQVAMHVLQRAIWARKSLGQDIKNSIFG